MRDPSTPAFAAMSSLLMGLHAGPYRPGGIRLGSGCRPAKGPPSKPTTKRAKVKAARKANHKRKK